MVAVHLAGGGAIPPGRVGALAGRGGRGTMTTTPSRQRHDERRHHAEALILALEQAVKGWIEDHESVHTEWGCGDIRCARRHLLAETAPRNCGYPCDTCTKEHASLWPPDECRDCFERRGFKKCDSAARILCVIRELIHKHGGFWPRHTFWPERAQYLRRLYGASLRPYHQENHGTDQSEP